MKQIHRIKLIIMLLAMVGFNAAAQQRNRGDDRLNSRQAAIVNISTFTAVGNLSKLKPALHAGLDSGLTINEVKEVLMHIYAYAGFPRSLRGIQTFMEVLDERRSKGITDKMGRIAAPVRDKRSRYARGKATLDKLQGVVQTGPPTGFAAFVPPIDTFLKEHLFADLFDRDILTDVDRELVTVSVNASIGGVEPMVRSHMGISLTIGITPAQLKHLIDMVERNIGTQAANEASITLQEVLKSKGLDAQMDFITTSKNNLTMQNIFPKGEKTPQEYFTGTAWVSRLVQQDAAGNYSVGNVTFEPGARTNWHKHAAGQTLLVLDGQGWYQEKGKPARAIAKGDVVVIPVDIEHWHGASKDSSLTHLAITGSKDGGVEWLQPVTDAEYSQAK